ncbi:MAG: imidazolonepropionase [Planctomycetota bacterium]|nr:MAG: imidazolonepropionase [Planctomycetota bacterium]
MSATKNTSMETSLANSQHQAKMNRYFFNAEGAEGAESSTLQTVNSKRPSLQFTRLSSLRPLRDLCALCVKKRINSTSRSTPRFATGFVVLAIFALIASVASAGPEIPGAPQSGPIAIVGATVHTACGPVIENGVVVFDSGKLTSVGGADTAIPGGATRIDAKGKHVFPGLIAANSTLGLVEVDSIRATIDHTEVGPINPNVRAQVAVNPDSELIPVTRANGVLLAQVTPRGQLIQGQSAVVALDGWTWEDMTLAAPVGMHINWPRMSAARSWEVGIGGQQPPPENRNEQLTLLRKTFDDARAYAKARAGNPNTPLDVRYEALLQVFDRKLPVFVRADEIVEIQAAVAFALKENLKLVIVGGYDAPHAAALLKEHDIPVVVNSVNRLPMRRSDPFDAPFTVPERLRQAGVKFCICDGGKFEASNIRNLPYEAAKAAAYGLPPDEALKSVTLSAAQILGIGDRAGSLEAGKDATLFIADGDILEVATHVEQAFVQGRQVDLSNRHKRLYEKYQEKQRREGVKR